ncbi:FIST N-terminal domain-containing protein [Methanopyrus kandleri]
MVEPEYIKCGVGVSEAGDPEEALEEAMDWGLKAIDSVFCVFSPTANDPEEVQRKLRRAIQSRLPMNRQFQMLGVSSSGEIATDGYHEGSVVVMAFEFTRHVVTGLSIRSGLSKDPFRVGRESLREATRSAKMNPLIALSGLMRVQDYMDLVRATPAHVILLRTDCAAWRTRTPRATC